MSHVQCDKAFVSVANEQLEHRASPQTVQDTCVTIRCSQLNSCNITNKYTCINYVLSHNTNYKHVSIAFVIIIKVVLEEYYEHNKLPN